jgi:plasmid stability protein
MPSLVVRNLDESIVIALKERAVAHQRSTEAEHRAILAEVLSKPKRKSFAEALNGKTRYSDKLKLALIVPRIMLSTNKSINFSFTMLSFTRYRHKSGCIFKNQSGVVHINFLVVFFLL